MVILAVVLFLTIGSLAGAAENVMDIGSRLELFADSYLVGEMRHAELRLQSPWPRGPVLRFDHPWEGRYAGYVTVFQDDSLFRMYYRGMPVSGGDGSDNEVTCYAESRDGIAWTKPKLGIFDTNGTRENNVILKGMAPFSHNFCPFLDSRPDTPAEERFKALAGTQKTGLCAFVSGDGIHWKKWQDKPVITKGAFDSQNVVFWSEAENLYTCYFRTWSQGEFKGYRTVSRCTSKDFIHWSEPVEMSFGDTPREHLYTNQTRPYFRAPQIYIAMPARFMPGRRVLTKEQFEQMGGEAGYSGDCSETVFMTSHGGTAYDRTFMDGFVRPGLGMNNWSSRTNYSAYGVVPTSAEEMSFYIQRDYGQPSHHLERFSLRCDGFASLHAGYAGGEMVSKPLRFKGRELIINYSTSAAGSVWVELQDAEGKPIPGYSRDEADEIVGDRIERAVTWKGASDVSALAGRIVRIRFILKDADVFSMRFR
ncbi:MAG: hypothetical protein AB1656_02815 [Candidatus Omnitrophota bacterium]